MPCEEAFARRCLQAYIDWHTQDDQSSPEYNDCLFVIDKPVYKGGRFMNLPFNAWLENKDEQFDKTLEKLAAEGATSELLMRTIGSQYMSESMRQRCLGPSIPDMDLPPLQLGSSEGRKNDEAAKADAAQATEGESGQAAAQATEGSTGEETSDASESKEQEKKRAPLTRNGRVASAVKCFMAHFLCNHTNLVACFNHPNAQPGLSMKLKMAIGVMRELFILPRFGSMQNFWHFSYAMMAEGETGILVADSDAKAMTDLLNATGGSMRDGCVHHDKRFLYNLQARQTNQQ